MLQLRSCLPYGREKRSTVHTTDVIVEHLNCVARQRVPLLDCQLPCLITKVTMISSSVAANSSVEFVEQKFNAGGLPTHGYKLCYVPAAVCIVTVNNVSKVDYSGSHTSLVALGKFMQG